MNKKNNRGQMETMGLLVIVILVSLILFFALSFGLKNKKTQQTEEQDFTEVQAVSNLGTTMLESTGPCDWTIRQLLTDCAYTHEITCLSTVEGVGVLENSCVAANRTINQMLLITLDEWGYDYRLYVIKNTGLPILNLSSGCQNTATSKTEITPFGTQYGSMEIKITMCK